MPKHVYFRTELPKTNVGKILRRTLRDELHQGRRVASDVPYPWYAGDSSWTAATIAATCSGSTPGWMPWPRLNTWPGPRP